MTETTSGGPLFLMDGPLASRIENGARVRIANGWIGPRFADFPPGPQGELDVRVISAATKAPTPAEVKLIYEMVDMRHGSPWQRALPAVPGHHTASLDFDMPGTYRSKVRVVLDGTSSDAVLLLVRS